MEKPTIIYKQIRDLKPYKKNAKKHTKKQVEQIANSIEEFGFTQPVLIDSQNNVVAGHGRILGAKKLGMKSVPTLCLRDLTPEQIKAYRLVDNKLNESEWILDALGEELDELSDFDMSLYGFEELVEETEPEEKEVSFKAKEKHHVIIICKTEQETKQVQKELEEQGYTCEVKNS